MLGASRLLIMEKDIASFCPITICEMFFWLISLSIILQLWRLFQDHLSPHQFEILAPKDCATIFFKLKPSSTYTLIWLWCKLTSKMFVITFFKLLFLRNYGMLKVFWRGLSPLPSCFMVFNFLFITSTGNMRKGSPLLNRLQARSKVTP
jgi:hypothetical protein